MSDLKTSEEWSKLSTVQIYDPDGWDRTNYQFSWHEELITREEFEKRMCSSTCMFTKPIFDKNGNVNSIWNDK